MHPPQLNFTRKQRVVLPTSLAFQRITHPCVIREESGRIRGSATDRQQRPSPLVSLVLLGLRAGVHSTALPLCTMIWLRAALTFRTNKNAVMLLPHADIRLPFLTRDRNPLKNRLIGSQFSMYSWLSRCQ